MFGDPEMSGGTRGTVVDKSASENRKTGALDLKMARAAAAIQRNAGVPVYMSNTSRLRILVAAGREFTDANGRRRDLPSISAKFNYGLYTPTSSFRRGSKEFEDEIKLIVDALETHPKMRYPGGLFWRADVALAAKREEKYKEAVALINDDADLKARFLAEISSEEMDAAVVRTQAKRKDQIEAARGKEEFKPRDPATRAAIMEKAAKTRDDLARKIRKEAEDGPDEEVVEDAPAPRLKKKKLRL
jgi:hypothetical protein